jgi:hypothetical protein
MRLILVLSIAALISSIPTGHVAANDSIARVGAGGIVLLKTEQVRMIREVLEISTRRVRVTYRFKNESSEDIRTSVAFPMPAYGWNPGQSAVDANERPLRPFTTLVDGQGIEARFERRAVVDGRDISDGLRRAGLSNAQIFETFGDCTIEGCPISAGQSEQIARLAGQEAGYPNWKVAETAYWEQMFPAGAVVQVQHAYPPFVGMSYSELHQVGSGRVEGLPTATWLSPPAKPNEACTDEGASQALEKRIRRASKGGSRTVLVTLQDVEYVLGTGRNWKGPIADFTLRIEKGSDDQVISLCFPGKPRKIDARTIEFHAGEFVPQDRLVVHFYSVSAREK